MTQAPQALLTLTPYEARTATAIFERLFPADAHDLGASAIGVVPYLDRALAGAYHDKIATYQLALAALDQIARQRYHAPFADCDAAQQDALLAALEQGALPDCNRPVLLRVEAQGSHGYRPLDRRIAEMSDIWAFAAYHLGMRVRPPNAVVQ